MKRLILTVTLIFTIQLMIAQNLSVGPTGGFGHAWFRLEENPANAEFEFHPTFNAGLQLLYSFPAPWGISAAVKYSREGANYEYNSSGSLIESKIKAGYVRVPIQLHYYFGDASNAVRPEVSIGPSIAFLAGGEMETYVNGHYNHGQELDEILEQTDVGINFAAGGNFKLGGDVLLSITANYYHGLVDIYENSTIDVMNRNIGLNLSLLFPIGNREPVKKVGDDNVRKY